MEAIVDSQIAGLVAVIVKAVNPDTIILFGSRARATARPDSDYDFLVVKSGIENEREVSRAVYRALFRYPEPASVDIVAVDADKFEKRKDDPWCIYKEANETGTVVYG
jgi:predicted nucleotidyltransferase